MRQQHLNNPQIVACIYDQVANVSQIRRWIECLEDAHSLEVQNSYLSDSQCDDFLYTHCYVLSAETFSDTGQVGRVFYV